MAPGLSGGLQDLPVQLGPAGDPPLAPEDLLMTFGDVTGSVAEPPGDAGPPPPSADEETMDQLLQVRSLDGAAVFLYSCIQEKSPTGGSPITGEYVT